MHCLRTYLLLDGQAVARAATRTPSTKRTFIAPAYNLAKKIMPKISETEAAALN